MNLDFSNCKTIEDVKKVWKKSKQDILAFQEMKIQIEKLQEEKP